MTTSSPSAQQQPQLVAPAAATAASPPFVFPGSAPRVRERKLSVGNSGGGSEETRRRPPQESDDDSDRLKPVENPLLALRSPLANAKALSQPSPLRAAAASPEGLRQRSGALVGRTGGSSSTAVSSTLARTTHQSSSNNDSDSKPAPPPKASWSLGTVTASSVGTSATDDSGRGGAPLATHGGGTTRAPVAKQGAPFYSPDTPPGAVPNCWILVYGYTDAAECAEIRCRFAALGQVIDYRVCPGRSGNWIAIRYASPLLAAKALCHQHVPLRGGGVYCGVKALADRDPLLRRQQSAATSSSASLWRSGAPPAPQNQDGGSSRSERQLRLAAAAGGTRTAPLGEDDILLLPSGAGGGRRLSAEDRSASGNNKSRDNNRSLCEILLRWLFSISD